MKMILIEDCCEILDSKRIPITAKNRIPGPYPYYGANGIQDYVDNYIFDDELVLLAEDGGNFGSTEKPIAYRVSGKCWVNNHAHVLKPRKGIDVDYLCYSLMFYDTNGLVNGATRQKLTQSTLKKMSIPKRTVKQQLQIVQELNTIKKLITARKQELQKLDDLIKARFVEMFGDNQEVHKLSDIAAITGGLTKNSRRDKLELRKPYLRVANVFFASIDTTEILDIGLTKEEYEKTLLRNGDLLFVEGNGSPDQIGRVAIWNGEIEDCVHQNHLIKARFDLKRMNPVFAMYYFISERGRNQIKKRAVSTSGLYTLSVSKIADFEIPNPPMELQQQFAAFVTAIDKSKATVQKALDETQLLFDSLMQQYFG